MKHLKILLLVFSINVLICFPVLAQEYPDHVFQQTKYNQLFNIDAIDVSVHPVNSDTLFVSTSCGVYKSFNGGDSWLKVEFIPGEYHRNNAAFWSLSFNPDNGNEIYASDADKLYKSTDCGENWDVLFQGEEMMNDAAYFAFGYDNPTTLYLSGMNGIWKSVNAGLNWLKIREAGGHIRTGPGNSVAVLDDIQGQASFICVSTDDFVSSDTLAQEFPPYQYIYDGDNNIIDSTGVAAWGLQDMVMDYYTDGRMLLTGNDGMLFESNDFGDTWQIVEGPGGFVMQTDPKDSSIIYAGGEYQVFKSADKGVSWQTLHESHNYRLTRCDISASTNEVIFVGNLGLEYMDEAGGWSRKSDDGIENIEIKQIFASNENPYITLVTDKIHSSADNGQTWTKYIPSTPDVFNGTGVADIGGIKEMEIVQGGSVMFLTGWAHHNGTFFKSTDYGSSWKNISPYYGYPDVGLTGLSGEFFAINPNKPDTIYVNASCEDSCVFRSIDGGLNWKAVNNGLDGMIGDLLIDHQNPRTLFAIGSGGRIFKTIDAGENWTLNHTGKLATNYWYMHMNPYNSNEIIAVQSWYNILTHTSDGGETWTEIDGDGEFVGRPLFDDTENGMVYYMTLNGDLHKSIDTLKTWQNLTGHISHSANPKGYTAFFKEGNTFLASISKSGLYNIKEINLDSTTGSASVKCINDSTGVIKIHTNKYYPQALYSINEGITTQSDSVFTKLPKGKYFPVVIIGEDTLSNGMLEINVLQENVVSLGDDINIVENGNTTLDAGDTFELYLWSDDSKEQTITINGSGLGEGSFIYWVQTSDVYSCISSDTLTINVSAPPVSDLADVQNEGVGFYPNPVYDAIYMDYSQCEEISIQIFDLKGKVVINKLVCTDNLDVSQLKAGTYFIQINKGKTYRMVKM